MAREAKFNFMPVHTVDLGNHSKAAVNINKRGILTFNRVYVKENGLKGKYIKFYTDITKKTLGWQIISTFDELSDIKKKKEYRKITTTKIGSAIISLVPILKKINPNGVNYTKLQVDTYIDTLFGKIYYVKLNK